MNDPVDTKELSGLFPSDLKYNLAGRLEDGHIPNNIETSTPRGSNAHTYNLRKKRKLSAITSTPAEHLQKQETRPHNDVKYRSIADATKSHPGSPSLNENPGRMFVTSSLGKALDSCLPALLHSPNGLRISTILNDSEIIGPVTLAVYRDNSQSFLEPFGVTKSPMANTASRHETQSNVSTITMTPLCQDMLTMNRQPLATELALDSDIEFMGKGNMRDIAALKRRHSLLDRASMSGIAPRAIVADNPKQVEGPIDSSATIWEGHKARFDTKREKLEEDASPCSANSSDTSNTYDESDDDSNDSGSEDDDISLRVRSHSKAPYLGKPTAFHPYIRGSESDASPLPCGDSPEGGGGTGGSGSQNTPASSAWFSPGGNNLHGIGQTPLDVGSGSSNQRLAPVLRDESLREEDSTPRKPLSLVCWYAAAGIACHSRQIKKDPEVRRLWK
jgi:hypothetical protein